MKSLKIVTIFKSNHFGSLTTVVCTTLQTWWIEFSFLVFYPYAVCICFWGSISTRGKAMTKTKCLLGTSISSSWSNRFYSSWTLNQDGCMFRVESRIIKKKKYENFRRKSFNLCLFLLNDEHRRLSNANIKKTSYIFFFLYPHKVTFQKISFGSKTKNQNESFLQ